MPFTDAERRLIAAGWTRASCDQTTYAAQHGISARTLRSWVERYGSGDRPEAKVRTIIEGAVERLQHLLAALDAVSDHQSGSGEGPVGDAVPERHAEKEPQVPGAARQPFTAPKPMPAAGYFAGF